MGKCVIVSFVLAVITRLSTAVNLTVSFTKTNMELTEMDIRSISSVNTGRNADLPKHVIDLMYGTKGLQKTKTHANFHPTGLLGIDDLDAAVTLPRLLQPWLTDGQKKLPPISPQGKARLSMFPRPKNVAEEQVIPKKNRYLKYDILIRENKFHKIAFISNEKIRDILPSWCQQRLRTACRSARFEPPLDKSILESISPLQFLAKYTRLYREQRRRYSRIFNDNKTKEQAHIDFLNLFPALNTMFGMFLSETNFNILCTALFIDKNTMMDETTFIGVCTFADRLFWTSYLDYLDRNTFVFLGPNRSVLEYVDFDNLKRKIDGLNLSKEMYHLLFSLS